MAAKDTSLFLLTVLLVIVNFVILFILFYFCKIKISFSLCLSPRFLYIFIYVYFYIIQFSRLVELNGPLRSPLLFYSMSYSGF